MGSSDPLPTGFEIRFGSLNFQATGNGYLMRITNVPRSTRGGQLGQDRFSSRPLPTPRRPPRRMLRALQHPDADDAPASAPAKRGWNGVGSRASPRSATHPLARRRRHPRDAQHRDRIRLVRQHRRGGI
jgi:hypothetical protein